MTQMSAKKVIAFAVLAGLAVAIIPSLLPTGPAAALNSSELLSSERWVLGALVVFLGGLLTALTPCVYPLIPITVGIFGARRESGRGRSMLLTSAYVLGMAAVFSALGLIAAKSGQAFGFILGDWRFALAVSIVLLSLAASMFGAFELALPPGLSQRLSSVGGAGITGAFLMGTVSGFIAAPCTGPVLAGLLAFVAKSQSSLLGAALLFLYALGVGFPFMLIGVFALRLPKGGAWMEWVKSILGIALLALAVSYLKDAVPALREAFAGPARELGRAPGTWVAAALAFAGIVAGAVHGSFKSGPSEFLSKACGVLLVAGALLLRGEVLNAPARGEVWARLCASEGDRSQWRIVPGGGESSGVTGALRVTVCRLQPQTTTELTWHLQFPKTPSAQVSVFDAALAQAHQQGRPVMIDFSAEWCAACKELDRYTYVDQSVISEANERFVNIKVDGTNELDSVDALYDRFGVQALPTIAFISSTGEVLHSPRVNGFLPPDQFLAELKKVR
jgi:thiol:disulfide interchange protein DsbD